MLSRCSRLHSTAPGVPRRLSISHVVLCGPAGDRAGAVLRLWVRGAAVVGRLPQQICRHQRTSPLHQEAHFHHRCTWLLCCCCCFPLQIIAVSFSLCSFCSRCQLKLTAFRTAFHYYYVIILFLWLLFVCIELHFSLHPPDLIVVIASIIVLGVGSNGQVFATSAIRYGSYCPCGLLLLVFFWQ